MLYIVDDDNEYALLLKEVSLPFESQIQIFNDPIAFTNKVRLHSSDVVLLDIRMPQMDGVEILRNLADKGTNAFIILISGVESGIINSASLLAQELGLNIVAKFIKPFLPIELITTLKNIKNQSLTKAEKRKEIRTSNIQAATKEQLKVAIDKKEICLHYQPQFELDNFKLCSVEGLLRWEHPKFGLITPDTFLPEIKKYEMLDYLTDYVIESAIETEANWHNLGINVSTSVNVNASNVINLSLPEKLESLIKAASIRPSKLCLEVTESELMTELIPSIDTLTRLRLKGFRLSIDDFGTGYSSLLQLYRIPFTELKIDRSFIQGLADNEESQVIVETCICMAHNLGMKVVAEGIENKKTLSILRKYGCDIGQGFYFSKAVPEHDLLFWFHENKKRLYINK